MKVKSESEVTQSCPTLSDPVDCSPPGSSIHGIFQARVLEWVAVAMKPTQTAQAAQPQRVSGNKDLATMYPLLGEAQSPLPRALVTSTYSTKM